MIDTRPFITRETFYYLCAILILADPMNLVIKLEMVLSFGFSELGNGIDIPYLNGTNWRVMKSFQFIDIKC